MHPHCIQIQFVHLVGNLYAVSHDQFIVFDRKSIMWRHPPCIALSSAIISHILVQYYVCSQQLDLRNYAWPDVLSVSIQMNAVHTYHCKIQNVASDSALRVSSRKYSISWKSNPSHKSMNLKSLRREYL